MGWRQSGRLPTIFVQALQGMKIGDTSDILRSPAGFHILKLVDKRGNDTPIIVTQTHARHILIRLNEVVSESDARHRLEELKDRVEHGADFGELARLHSDDTTAARGGDLGWVSPGDTVPEFERAMDALKVKSGERAVQEPLRLACRAGAGAARPGHVPGSPAPQRASGYTRAQVGRAMAGVGASAARQSLRRVSPGRKIGRVVVLVPTSRPMGMSLH